MVRIGAHRLGTPSLALAVGLVLAACGGAAGGGAAPAPAAGPAHQGAGGATGYPHTPADVRFMTAMIAHHAQAIRMARLAATHGASPSVRTLADRIINAQQDEIATMQQWLRDRGLPLPAPDAPHAHGAHGGHAAPMHGMLSEAQMQELDRARGADFDMLFLRLMIQHHRGAVAMVSELFSTPGAGQNQTVFKFATDVNVDQSTEIQRMEKMLTALILEGRP